MALLHHVTWSINSVCHVVGRRPFRTTDHSGNVAALAVISLGESWHNLHHAMPSFLPATESVAVSSTAARA